MIDPTAVAAAIKAYAGVRAFIEAGKSIEDTFQVVARGRATPAMSCMQARGTRNAPTHSSK